MKKLNDYQKLQLRIVEQDLQQAFLRLSDMYMKNIIGKDYYEIIGKIADSVNELHELIKK